MQLCCDRRLRGAAARCDAATASRTSYKWTNQACLRGNSPARTFTCEATVPRERLDEGLGSYRALFSTSSPYPYILAEAEPPAGSSVARYGVANRVIMQPPALAGRRRLPGHGRYPAALPS